MPGGMMVIGFVILSHQHPGQLARLIRTLNRLYDEPPIACHHDMTQSVLDGREFPGNVSFVSPCIRTGWGKWSVVEAGLAALALLYDKADPDWVILLSAADYPVAPAHRVRADLAACGVDALLDHREAGADPQQALSRFGPRNPVLDQFEAPGNRAMLPHRYMGAELWLPIVRRHEIRGPRIGRHTLHLPFLSPSHPFSGEYRCHYGDHWFTASRAAATALLNPTPRERRLQRHLRWRAVPEECYYHSVLCNRPELSVQRDNRRYAQWNGGGAHPAFLGLPDFAGILRSNAHFARKFKSNDPVLDALDDFLWNGTEAISEDLAASC